MTTNWIPSTLTIKSETYLRVGDQHLEKVWYASKDQISVEKGKHTGRCSNENILEQQNYLLVLLNYFFFIINHHFIYSINIYR